MPANKFPRHIVEVLRIARIMGVRAGVGAHRIIGIWPIVVENRIFARSWSIKARGWYTTLQTEPFGVLEVDGKELPMRAVFTRSERLKDEVTRAYREKFNTTGAQHFVRGFAQKKRRNTTIEFVPAPSRKRTNDITSKTSKGASNRGGAKNQTNQPKRQRVH